MTISNKPMGVLLLRFRSFFCVPFLFVLMAALPAMAFQPVYVLGGGNMGGTYYGLGGVIAETVNERVPGIRMAVQPTGGTRDNIELLEQGLNQFALTDGFVAMAYEGRDLFYERPQTYLRAVMPLYPEVARVLVPAGSAVTGLADLAGKRVAVGRRGSGVLVTARQILLAAGIRSGDVELAYLGMGEGLLALKKDEVDAVVFVGPLGGGSAMEQEIMGSLTVLGLDAKTRKGVLDSAPYWREFKIPAGTFAGQDKVLETVGSWTILSCREDLDDDLVYRVTQTLYENASSISDYIPGSVKLEPNQVRELLIPLHDGAERFYKEAGVF